MKRSAPGYSPTYRVAWLARPSVGRSHLSAPCLLGWGLEVCRRMRARGHDVSLVRRS